MKRAEVIKGLECCKQGVNLADARCGSCPYADRVDCDKRLMADALDQLKQYNKDHVELVNQVDILAKMVRKLNYAHWVAEPDRERHWHCSNCGKVQGIASMAMKYCPECGASMAEHPWAGSGCGQAFSLD